MKLRLSLLSKNEVLLVEHYERYLRFYYSDGHYEIVDKHIKEYITKRDGHSYKNPILIYSGYLHPTMSRSDINCKWINLDYFMQSHHLFRLLLKQKGLYEKAKKMYLKYIVEDHNF